MAALEFDLEIEQGSDYEKSFPVIDTLTNQTVEDLSGWSVKGQIRSGHLASALLHELDVTFVGLNARLLIPASVSSAWIWQKARYDVEVTDPDGKVTRFLKGLVIVDYEQTREA